MNNETVKEGSRGFLTLKSGFLYYCLTMREGGLISAAHSVRDSEKDMISRQLDGG